MTKQKTFSLEAAMADPPGVFSSPDEVTHHPKLSLDEKIQILKTWAHDIAELQVADEENMLGTIHSHDEDLNETYHQIMDALHELGLTKISDRAPPTKHRD